MNWTSFYIHKLQYHFITNIYIGFGHVHRKNCDPYSKADFPRRDRNSHLIFSVIWKVILFEVLNHLQ